MARNHAAILAPLVLLLFASDSADGTGADPQGRAELQHELGTDFVGTVMGSCDATAALIDVSNLDELRIEAAGVSWLRERVAFNFTSVDSPLGEVVRVTWANVTQESATLPAGEVRVQFAPKARLDVYGGPGPDGSTTPEFQASFAGDRFAAGQVVGATETLLTYTEWMGTPVPEHLGVGGPNRLVKVAHGEATFMGDLTLYVESVMVTGQGGFQTSVPQREEPGPRAGVPGMTETGVDYENWAFLTLEDAQFTVPSDGVELYCHGLHAALEGRLNAYWAQGTIHLGQQTVAFHQREFTLEGAFAWDEAPEGRVVHTVAHGRFDSASVDFQFVGGSPAGWTTVEKVGLWTAVLAALGAALYAATKGLVALFSRLRDDQVTGHGSRRLLLQTVRGQPNVRLHELVRTTGLSKSEVRYHARILETRGLLRSHKVRHDRCFVAKETIAREGRGILESSPALVARLDRPVGLLLESLPPTGLRMKEVLEMLSLRLAISKPGAWKAVLRAEQQGMVRRERVGREVWVRCVPHDS